MFMFIVDPRETVLSLNSYHQRPIRANWCCFPLNLIEFGDNRLYRINVPGKGRENNAISAGGYVFIALSAWVTGKRFQWHLQLELYHMGTSALY